MNDLFIQGLTIDWNRVRPYNYAANVLLIMFHQRKIVGTFAQFAFGRMTRLLLLIATPVT